MPELYEQIGRLQMELEWLKKRHEASLAERRALIEPQHPQLSVHRRCQLLGLPRSSVYYQPGAADRLTLELMNAIDRIYTQHPIYGVRRIGAALRREGRSARRGAGPLHHISRLACRSPIPASPAWAGSPTSGTRRAT